MNYLEKYLDRYTKRISNQKAHNVTIKKIEIEVDENVFSPNPEHTYSSSIILDNLPNLTNKYVLDLGTGTGILSIYSAKNNAKSVTAVDIDLKAVKNAKRNVSKHDLEKVIDVKESDLFKKIDEKYDIILANLPILNKDFSIELLNHAPNYLNRGGKLLLTSAGFGTVNALNNLGERWTYEWNRTTKFGVDWLLYTFTLK